MVRLLKLVRVSQINYNLAVKTGQRAMFDMALFFGSLKIKIVNPVTKSSAAATIYITVFNKKLNQLCENLTWLYYCLHSFSACNKQIESVPQATWLTRQLPLPLCWEFNDNDYDNDGL